MYQRVNVQSGAHIGSAGALPAELVGLSDHVLANLSAFMDPNAMAALGYTGHGFLPVEVEAPTEPEPEPRRLPKVDFWRRFTPLEQVALLGSRKALNAMTPQQFSDPASAGWWALAVALQTLDMISEFIEIDHPETEAGLGAFAAAGIIAPERIPVILQ